MLTVAGASLRLVVVGDGARPIVLLHGGPGASHDYLRPQMDALLGSASSGRRLVYYDQRGSGGSTLTAGTPPPTAADHVADLEAVRVSLGVGRLAMCGYSWGGLLACLYAVAHPDRVERMALVSPAPLASSERPLFKERLAAMGRRPEVAALRATLIADEGLDPQTATAPKSRQARFALAVAGYFVDPRLALGLTPFIVQQRVEESTWASLGDFDLRPQLARLAPRAPALVVHGEDDPIPVETARATAAALGAQLVTLPRCGHVPYVEAPDALFAALNPFFG
jgi:proline iminopeptidase